MATIVCPHCGEQVSENAKKCVHCGAILIPEEKKYCTECGAELEEGMTECPNCGCPVDDTLGQETDEKPQKVEVTGVMQFTMPSGLHSVLERPFSEANGRPFLVKRSPLIVC